uniref:lysozyme inhibitor LprI family protein n=1 Tax=uncultured Sphingomonas sp. TaxID=158754 RepID=UPI002608DA8C
EGGPFCTPIGGPFWTPIDTSAATEVVDALSHEAAELEAFHSNYAMKARTGAAYGVADAHLEQALMDLRLLLSESEEEAWQAAQDRWREYRTALEVCAALEFEGGTHASLAQMMAGLSETERRTLEIRAQIEERSSC